MTSRDFIYWLQGLFEIGNPSTLDANQVDCIKRHLGMVFKHEIDPSFGDELNQAKLDALHAGPPKPPRPAPQIGGVDPATGLTFRC